MTNFMLSFVVFIEPSPTQQGALRILKNKAGRMFVGKMSSSKASKWKREFIAKVRQHAPAVPLDCPLEIEIGFEYPFLKKHKDDDLDGIIAKTTRPDLDNLEKMVLDGLVEAGVMKDDALVCSKRSHKLFSSEGPRITIDISLCTW
jgi:Holliday junction resolvase RusA-like endonuclease